MDIVLRSLALYLFLLLLMRISGARTLAQLTAFDFVLLLVVGEATQQALLGDDFSVTTAFIAIATLIGADIALSHLKRRLPRIERIIDGLPMLLVENGRLLTDRLNESRIDEEDILSAARRLRGLERLDQIKFAVLETDGHITIVPENPEVIGAAPIEANASSERKRSSA